MDEWPGVDLDRAFEQAFGDEQLGLFDPPPARRLPVPIPPPVTSRPRQVTTVTTTGELL